MKLHLSNNSCYKFFFDNIRINNNNNNVSIQSYGTKYLFEFFLVITLLITLTPLLGNARIKIIQN